MTYHFSATVKLPFDAALAWLSAFSQPQYRFCSRRYATVEQASGRQAWDDRGGRSGNGFWSCVRYASGRSLDRAPPFPQERQRCAFAAEDSISIAAAHLPPRLKPGRYPSRRLWPPSLAFHPLRRRNLCQLRPAHIAVAERLARTISRRSINPAPSRHPGR